MSIIELTDDNYNNEIKKANKTTLIEFYADRCPACKFMTPIISSLSEQQSELTVATVNTDQNPELTSEFEVKSIPTVVVLKDGKEVGRKTGAMRPAALNDFIDQCF